MKVILAMGLILMSIHTFAATKKMSCAVSENTVLVKTVDIELNDQVNRAEFGVINELTVILTDIPNSNQVSLKMIGAELGIIVETIGAFGPQGEGISSSILYRGYTTAIACAPVK